MKNTVVNTLRRDHLQRKSSGKPAFTLLELIVVLLVLGVLAVISVPTFNRIKENSAERVAQSTLEAIDRNGEAIAVSDPDLSDAQIAAASIEGIVEDDGLTIDVVGAQVTVSVANGSITAEGDVEFSGGIGTITPAAVTGGSGPTTTAPAGPALSLSYAVSAFSPSGESQTLTPTVTGGIATSFALTGTLPTGVSFNPTTGVFTGASSWNFEAVQIDAGSYGVCARTSAGTVYCWGNNDDGELGDGTSTNTFVPVRMRNADGSVLSGVTEISVGEDHSCALLSSGQVRCWGYNNYGRLGDGSTTTTATGTTVVAVGQSSGGTPLSGVSKLASGGRHTCALLTSGGVVCWGFNDRGQLGNDTSSLSGNTAEYSTTPVNVLAVGQTNGGIALSGITDIAAGHSHTCAATSAGDVVCWGSDSYGQIGQGLYAHTDVPVQVVGSTPGSYLTGASSISAGYRHSCALLTSGEVNCWGWGSNGKLGNGLTSNSNQPVVVIAPGESAGGSALGGIASVHAGYSFTCAKTTSGQAVCWGSNWDSEGGNGTSGSNSLAPVAVVASNESSGGTALSGVSAMTVGYFFGCATLTSGTTQCWGQNNYGEIAQNPDTIWNSTTPQTVSGSGPNSGFPAAVTVTVSTGSGSDDTSFNLTFG